MCLMVSALAHAADLAMITLSLPQVLIGEPFTTQISVSGGKSPYTFTIDEGSLPVGLFLSQSGSISGTVPIPAANPITGPPPNTGIKTFLVSVTDANGTNLERSLSLEVLPVNSLWLSDLRVPVVLISRIYSYQIAPIGGKKPYYFKIIDGSLPNGINLSPEGLLHGTGLTGGLYTFKLRIQDSIAATIDRTISITVNAATPRIIESTIQPCIYREPYLLQLSGSGGAPPYKYTLSYGYLPPGILLSPEGVLSGNTATLGSFAIGITVKDTMQNVSETRFTFDVSQGPKIITLTATELPTAQIGLEYSSSINPSGGIGPYTFALRSGTTPAGINLSSEGRLSGTPAEVGKKQFTLTVKDSQGSTGILTMNLDVVGAHVTNGPQLLSTLVPPGTIGTGYSFNLSFHKGSPPYRVELYNSELPKGINMSQSGRLTGVPIHPGSYSFSVTITDAFAVKTFADLKMLIAPNRVRFVTGAIPDCQVMTLCSITLAAEGGRGPYIFRLLAGLLPPGLSLFADGRIAGTPTVSGSTQFSVNVEDSGGQHSSMQLTHHIKSSRLTLKSPFVPTAKIFQPYKLVFTSTGGAPPYNYQVADGSLPPGLSLSSNGNLTGIPTNLGVYTFSTRVIDSNNNSSSVFLDVSVLQAEILLDAASLPTAYKGRPYSVQLIVPGSLQKNTFLFTAPMLPEWLTLSDRGLLTGTPTSSASIALPVNVSNPIHGKKTYHLNLIIGESPLIFSSRQLEDAKLLGHYSERLTPLGGTKPYHFALGSGRLPSGLILTEEGQLSGPVTEAGAFEFEIVAKDALSTVEGARFRLKVSPTMSELVITQESIRSWQVLIPLAFQYRATGNKGSISWSLSAGAIPQGMLLDVKSGLLSGTPILEGDYTFTIRATDEVNTKEEVMTTLIIASAQRLPDATVDSFYYTATEGLKGDVTLDPGSSGLLPLGLSLASGGRLAGYPRIPGHYVFGLQTMDASGNPGKKSYSLDVLP